ncbi:MAG: T9SS type A sorting domain-containing protein [Bacteroidia bacterium]|nr:T9SS type A sorting domain-containing protein [Bacteroidia bacterium]
MKNPYCFIVAFTLIVSSLKANGLWTRKNDFPGNARDRAISFSIADRGYYGCGNHWGGSPETADMWKYDPFADSWIQIADYPMGMQAGECFTINGVAYAGSGWRSGNSFANWYKYSSVTNVWSSIASLPSNTVHDAGMFVLNGKGYVVGGAYPYSNAHHNTLFEYDPAGDLWTQRANFPQFRRVPFSIGLNGYGYAGLGQLQGTQGNAYDMYRYDPVIDGWTPLSGFPNSSSSTYDSRHSYFLLNDTAYVVLQNEFWRYIPAIDQWDSLGITPFSGGVDGSFTINNKAYVILHNSSEVWQFDPHGLDANTSSFCDTLYYGNGNANWFGQLLVASDGNLVTVGTENHVYNWSSGDIVLSKYDTAFNLIWARKFYVGGGMDVANGVLETSDGGYLIHRAFGNTNAAGNFSAGYIVKTDSAGNLEWQQTLTGQSFGDNYGCMAVENSQGEFIVYGQVQNHAGCGGYSTRLSKLSASGSILWSNCYPLNPDWTGGIVKLPFSDVYVSAYSNQATGYVEMRQWDDAGNQTGFIDYRYGNQFNSVGSVMPCPSGGYFLVGQYNQGNGNKTAYVAKFDDAMVLQWESSDGIYSENYFFSLTTDAAGEVYCTGLTNFAGQPGDLIVSRFDAGGQFLDHSVFGSAGTEEYGSGIIAFANGDVVCSGRSGSEALLVKICGSVTTSIADQSREFAPITVFPNPAKDYLRIRVGDVVSESVTCRIFNSAGQCVLVHGDVHQRELVLNLSDIFNGVYFLQMTSESMAYKLKVVIAQ